MGIEDKVAEDTGKVDLFTTSREFDSIILGSYPGTIFEDQYKKDKTNPKQTMFCFYDLNFSELWRFLPEYRGEYEFEIRNSKTGCVI